MRFTKHAEEAWHNLLSSKLRSLLALLGIFVGTASVVAMVSSGQLATQEALRQFKTLGTDLLAISLSDPEDNGTIAARRPFSLDSINALGRTDPSILELAPYSQLFSSMRYEGQPLPGDVLGVTDSFARVVHVELAAGRFISWLDSYERYCVVGNQLKERMKEILHEDVIGKQIQVGNAMFTVIGVAKPWPENSFVYANIDHAIMVPILTSLALNKYTQINNIILRLSPDARIQSVEANLTRFIEQQHLDKRLFFRSAEELVARMGAQRQIFTVFLGLIGGISLLVGGIGVMNIMLVSMIERRREIGIRLAVGAKPSDIKALFLTEAVMLSFLGGLLGVFVGMLISYLMAVIWHWEFVLLFFPPCMGFLVSVATGIFFGYYPAYKAAKLDPIQALRSDV